MSRSAAKPCEAAVSYGSFEQIERGVLATPVSLDQHEELAEGMEVPVHLGAHSLMNDCDFLRMTANDIERFA
jgi:hypothetical protein